MRGRASSVAARENARGALDLYRGFCKWVAVCRRPTAVYLGLISTLEDDKAGTGGRDALSQISNGVCSDNQWVRVELPVSPDCERSPRGYQVTAHVCQSGDCAYLLTWNCRHIANAEMQRAIRRVVERSGYQPPILCTPEELMGEEQ
jgi:hypothetical protein